MKKTNRALTASFVIVFLLSACSTGTVDISSAGGTDPTEAVLKKPYSHSDETEPDFDIVFPDDRVNEIIITITSENWDAIFEDMNTKYGAFGSNEHANRMQPGGNRPQMDNTQLEMQDRRTEQELFPQGDADKQQPPNDEYLDFQGRGAMGGGMMMGGDSKDNPKWVEADIEFGDEVWEHVGFRLKGNSSLKNSWNSGSYKLPFKLDFDQYEDDYAETMNQRFYGFKQLTFSSNFSDTSYLREKVSADIFRAAGVPSAHTAFYAVYIDHGEGPIYFGLYTAVEVVDDTVIQTQFEDDSGNVYKPSGSAAAFTAGSYNEELYDKETNQDEEDYSDVKALLQILHSDLRTSNAGNWRAELESIFDVDNFLQWLAVNTVIQNWDTYGNIAHNYYLYHDPVSDQLVWIPWDNNMALSAGAGGDRNPMGRNAAASIDHKDIGDNWPLISYLLSDEIYLQQYNESVEDVITSVVNPEMLNTVFRELHEMVRPYVEAEREGYTTLSSLTAFNNSLSELIEHISSRYTVTLEYLKTSD